MKNVGGQILGFDPVLDATHNEGIHAFEVDFVQLREPRWIFLGCRDELLFVRFLTGFLRQWSPADMLNPATGWPLRDSVFGGMLAYDSLAVFARIFLIASTGLIIWLSLLTGIPDREDSTDFYTLLLGATIGMCVMASANHLLMVFIGVEMASLPSYAMAGFMKGRRQSSEAALKYVVYGGGALPETARFLVNRLRSTTAFSR